MEFKRGMRVELINLDIFMRNDMMNMKGHVVNEMNPDTGYLTCRFMGVFAACKPDQLKPIITNLNEKTTWSECAWKPEGVK